MPESDEVEPPALVDAHDYRTSLDDGWGDAQPVRDWPSTGGDPSHEVPEAVEQQRVELADSRLTDGADDGWGACPLNSRTPGDSVELTDGRTKRIDRARELVDVALVGDTDAPKIYAGVIGELPTSAGAEAVAEANDDIDDAPEAIAPSQADLQLTPAEHSAISTYTRVSYETLNHSLWNGTIDDVSAVAAFSHDLSAGLAKLPDYEGAVLRGSHPDRPAAAYDLERYESGSVVIENGYISSTVSPEVEFNGEVLWIIESKHGKDVENLTSVKGEQEVLFDRFTKFFVLSKEYEQELGSNGRWLIYMEEV